jgi:tetratricopeptide (TPR) repeat protein
MSGPPAHYREQVSDLQRLLDPLASSPEADARHLAAVTEIAASVRAAVANPQQAERDLLTKVAGRLRDIPATVGTDSQLETLQVICRFFLSKDQDLPFAMEAAAGLIRLARAAGRKPELFNGLLMQAVIASQLDNHIEALETCASAREVAVQLGSPMAELKAVVNAAAFLLNVGQFEDALTLLRNALTIADRTHEADDFVWMILGNIAQCYLFLREFEDALRTVTAAKAMASEPATAHAAGNRAIVEYTHLRTLVAMKRGNEARPVLESIAKYAAQAGTVRARIDYACARGMVEVVEGQRDLGLSRIVTALEKGKHVTSTMPDVLAAMALAQEAAGNPDAAEQCREQLRQLLATRQETSRLRAALMLGPSVGVSGQTERSTEYDRRLDAARERLLRHQT